MRLLPLLFASLAICNSTANGQAAAPSSTLGVLKVNIPANNLAWDPNSTRIYLSIPSSAGANGNAIQVLNPSTGQLGANVFVGSEPNLLSVSAQGKYLYVGLNGASSVQRMTLPNLGLDVKMALGSGSDGSYVAGDLQASPVADGTVAVVRNAAGVSPGEEGGVAIYDDAVARPNAICGFIQIGCSGPGGMLFNSIQWNADASVMFAANNEDTGFDFYTVPVTASGFGKVTDYPGLAGGFGNRIHFDRTTGYVYDDNGAIIDPVAAATVGKFNASGWIAPDGALGRAFILSQNFGSPGLTLTAFDIQRFTPIASLAIPNVVGTPTQLLRWGSSGLAFTTVNSPGSINSPGSALYLLSGSFVSSVVPQPSIVAGGVSPVGSASNTVQPGEWISIYGGGLASGAAVWDGTFKTSLSGASVTIDGKNAYLSYVSPWQINAQVPDDTAAGPVPVVVTTAGGTATSTVTLAPVAPSLPLLDNSHVAGIIPRADHSGAYGGGTYDILGPTGTSLGYRTVAAKAGDTVWLYAVGLGPTNPQAPAGQAFSGAAPATNNVALSINNVNVPLSFAGLSSAGLYQLNFTVPMGLGSGDLPLEVVVAGMQTPSGDVISLQ